MKKTAIVFALWSISVPLSFGYDWSTNPGDGSPGNPYHISEPNHLMAIGSNANLLDKHFILTNNIVFDPNNNPAHIFDKALIAPDTSSSNGFQGIAFTGVFDGGGYSLFNLKIESSTADYVGLFGKVGSGEVKHLRLEQVNIQADQCVGALAGHNYGGSISSCYSTGNISGSSFVGGFVSANIDGIISGCHSSGQISGSYYVGGFTGSSGNGSTITGCSADTRISVPNNVRIVGGFVASHGQFNNTIQNCTAAGTINTGSECDSIGGFAGSNDGFISNCSADCAITTESNCYNIGGFAGANFEGMLVHSFSEGSVTCASNCHNIGGLTGTGPSTGPFRGVDTCYSSCDIILPSLGCYNVGGLIGVNSGGIISSAYFLESAGPDNGWGTPLDDPNMMIQANFVGWDFVGEDVNGENEIWRMCVDGVEYPRLSWEFAQNGDFACPDGTGMEDLLALAEKWLTSVAANPATFNYACDADGNEKINSEDFAILSQHWLND